MARRLRKNDPDQDFVIEKLSILVEAIAKMFGDQCEVVLHDLRKLEKSIIKIEHGYITGRKVGGSITDLALKNLKRDVTNDLLLNYPTKTKEGRTLKSTTVLIRNKENIPFAALCINFDVTNLLNTCSMVNEFCQTDKQKEIDETFEPEIGSTINAIINNILNSCHITVPAMRKEDKIRIVAKLHRQGVFNVKGGIKVVSRKLNVSKYTIYNYLDEIKSKNQKFNDLENNSNRENRPYSELPLRSGDGKF